MNKKTKKIIFQPERESTIPIEDVIKVIGSGKYIWFINDIKDVKILIRDKHYDQMASRTEYSYGFLDLNDFLYRIVNDLGDKCQIDHLECLASHAKDSINLAHSFGYNLFFSESSDDFFESVGEEIKKIT
jgi:hypothetical protein